MTLYAHTAPEGDWQPLDRHLENVAKLAADFASRFGGGELASRCGMLHDIGKGSEAFQRRLLDSDEKVDHSTCGAQHAVMSLAIPGHLLAYAIAGHHGGLPDGISSGSGLEDRLRKKVESIPPELLEKIRFQPTPSLPLFLKEAFGRKDGFSTAFFTRMLFSCLVDADFLDTERFMNPEKAANRKEAPAGIAARMEVSLERRMAEFAGDSEINRCRAEVRQACLDAANMEPGFFTLSVPTGGGKTLASLSFALRHAKLKGMSRIVYVAPFTSILEQNAGEFRKALRHVEGFTPEELVLEHHSNFDVEKETLSSRLACENWDAPLIATSSVQFYESLFASKTSSCRKLHNLANSVVLLDEAQTLPVNYLEPCLKALKELVSNYGVSVVLCTATQPEIRKSQDFKIGIEIPPEREIAKASLRLHARLKRVAVSDLGRRTDDELGDILKEQRQVLCIVNTRGHAKELMKRLGEGEGNCHLSALMCPEHRMAALESIRAKLDGGLPCRVVSTQLVEAGVDIDFPVVFRSLAGLDSIAQAAGRCNRNGRLLPELGKTFVFQSEHDEAERFVKETANCAKQTMEMHKDSILSPKAIESYFKLYYWDQKSRWDEEGICGCFKLDGAKRDFPFILNFKTAAERFKLIEDGSRPVFTPWGPKGELLLQELLKMKELDRDMTRRLQRFTVQIPERKWLSAVKDRTLTILFDGAFAMPSCQDTQYSEIYGLDLEAPSGQAICM